ncbi:prolyl aminopeptidase [Poseidonocella sp. HB161398]|uniref:prolyl aminopeptidase n=1 Tax=Poseidonocella sp. HB161398 TaxID=2320855 RepID=UPI0011092FA6|nr:prolyl aminopeptidase [Poseidonocella sp. HB161398]
MEQVSGQKRTAHQFLYPPVDAYDQRMMETGDGHRIYVEQCGAPDGIPVVVVHGGPGGGCSPAMRRYFDPSAYRIILFDQRGCGRSRPHASVESNTTWHLVADMERIRSELGIERWIVFGGSWGATLSLIYAITHPERAAYLALRGIFLMTPAELDWFYGGGAGQFWPDVWDRFVRLIPEDERGDLIAAYHKRLFSGDSMVEIRHARAWASWENALASIQSQGLQHDSPADYARAFSRLENHYFIHGGFLDSPNWILENIGRIADVPGAIVQGRYDMICPPQSAWNLSRAWPRAELKLVPNAGHALSEPGISAELVRITNILRNQRGLLGF